MQKYYGEWIRRSALVALTTATILTAACGGGGGGGGGSGGQGGKSGSGGNGSPTISGKPAEQAEVGSAYRHSPSAQDPDGDTLAFSIENRPGWASFNTATGELSGVPRAGDVGTSGAIVISVSDGTNRASLPAFSITVAAAGTKPSNPGATGSVALSWEVPTLTIGGGNLVDLAGYRIHYGRKATALTGAIDVASPGMNNFVVRNLVPGTYYFAVRAITANGTESELSNVITKVVS